MEIVNDIIMALLVASAFGYAGLLAWIVYHLVLDPYHGIEHEDHEKENPR